jgi:hypothetical protein
MVARTSGRCAHCAVLFPDEWPRDAVLEAGELEPVDAARQLLVFTRILHAAQLPRRHRDCLAACGDWLRELRAAARQLRAVGVERELYDLWRRQMRAAHAAVRRELAERPARELTEAEALETQLRAIRG